MNSTTVERLERATHAVFATGLGSMWIAVVLHVLGMEDTAVRLATLGLILGTLLGVVMALVTEAAEWLVERRSAKRRPAQERSPPS